MNWFAQIDLSPMLAYGPLGIFCAWMMVLATKFTFELIGVMKQFPSQIFDHLHRIEHTIRGLSRAIWMSLAKDNTLDDDFRQIAKEAIAKLDAMNGTK